MEPPLREIGHIERWVINQIHMYIIYTVYVPEHCGSIRGMVIGKGSPIYTPYEVPTLANQNSRKLGVIDRILD